MSHATNAADGTRVYFEDDGGDGVPVLFYGGIFDWVEQVRASEIARALPKGEFRHIYVDHRGIARSDKPHDMTAYAMPLRAGDAVAVLDALNIERAHFVGSSWGGRLGFGFGEHAPDRTLALVLGGQQPYAIDPEGPLVRVVTEGLHAAQRGGMEALLHAMEDFWHVRFPDWQRGPWLENDPAAIQAAWSMALSEGPISRDLGAWGTPCLIYAGVSDADFYEQARAAAEEIPNAEFISLGGEDHFAAHNRTESIIATVLRVLRSAR